MGTSPASAPAWTTTVPVGATSTPPPLILNDVAAVLTGRDMRNVCFRAGQVTSVDRYYDPDW